MMNEARPPADDRSLGELFGDLSREITTLVRQEATLARTEMTQKVAQLGKDAGMLAFGGALAYAGLLAIVAAIISGLAAAGLAWWASALIVGVVVAAIGYGLVMGGMNALKHEDLTPRETIDSLKEEGQWTNRRAA
jgi:hypothetical protein